MSDVPDLAQALAGGRDLVYSADTDPGISRKRAGKAFRYVDAQGRAVRDARVLKRINALAIPPAYEDVWICPDPKGHIQATARDARGRKQYRYHEHWKEIRDADKYRQLAEFGAALPRIRRRVERDMRSEALTVRKVTAVVVRLLDLTLIRVGTREYAKTNKSFGLTTLRRRHASVMGSRIRFQFRGKSGVRHDVTINDRRIARVIRRCMEIPGHELFQFRDAQGDAQRIDSGCVNAYLKEAGGGDFTAKHYRTWAASVLAFSQLQDRGSKNEAPDRTAVAEACKATAQMLGNTPAICRDCYIHPAVTEAYLAGTLPPRSSLKTPAGLRADERRFLAFLRAC
ncbi:DNA topoisomerase IB [Pollutimonas sp. M17]|uniref:DNA topoisomerase IB n=1 Tax=Pollutimonas sp. M17 TaxID=2962065 RepID=UPI0021F4C9DF|nr:DNA topoisomerase IB [Pollutimonas sp. M17]UYO92179.1 DNA topoisomerase IB [Pollutimonas sp. M17]